MATDHVTRALAGGALARLRNAHETGPAAENLLAALGARPIPHPAR